MRFLEPSLTPRSASGEMAAVTAISMVGWPGVNEPKGRLRMTSWSPRW